MNVPAEPSIVQEARASYVLSYEQIGIPRSIPSYERHWQYLRIEPHDPGTANELKLATPTVAVQATGVSFAEKGGQCPSLFHVVGSSNGLLAKVAPETDHVTPVEDTGIWSMDAFWQ